MAEPVSHLASVEHKILVLSGKGGVGKSTVATQLALAFVRAGKKVGLLDVDLTGPSVPHIMGLDKGEVVQSTQGFVPVYTDETKNLGVVSLGFLLQNKDDPVVWRGPKKNAVIKNFMEDVAWGKIDYLIIDTPPGTSDEHISTIEHLAAYTPDGAVLVTTPQGVATSDVQRELSFCQKTNLPVLGVVENMSGFYCPTCSECTYVFSRGGGEELAKQRNVPFIGRIPIDPRIAVAMDEGKPVAERFPESGALKVLDDFARTQIALHSKPATAL